MSGSGQPEKCVGWRMMCHTPSKYIAFTLLLYILTLIPVTAYALKDAPAPWLRTLCDTGMRLDTVSVDPATATLVVGQTEDFKASGTFSDGTTQDLTAEVSWTSSDESVGTITDQGQFTALKDGQTTIQAALGGKTGTATVTVRAVQLDRIDVSPSSTTLDIDDRRNFEARGTFSDGSSRDLTNNVEWSSSNTGVGTIDDAGRFTAKTAGRTTVKATLNGKEDTATVTVRAAQLDRIDVSPSSVTLDVDDRRNFTARGTFSDGSSREITGSVNWSSSNTGVGTINDEGRFTAKQGGRTTVKASQSGKEDTASVTVRSPQTTRDVCLDKFGSAPGYQFCSGRSSSSVCAFAAKTEGTCDAMCKRFNSTCKDAFFNEKDDCVEDGRAECDKSQASNICVCER